MSCGCAKTGSNMRITSSAICTLFPKSCAYLRGGERAYPPVWCDVGQHNIVRWAGVRWYGLPMPLRFCLWVKLLWIMKHDAPEWETFAKLPGCGCVVVLKDRYERVRKWLAKRSRSVSFSS